MELPSLGGPGLYWVRPPRRPGDWVGWAWVSGWTVGRRSLIGAGACVACSGIGLWLLALGPDPTDLSGLYQKYRGPRYLWGIVCPWARGRKGSGRVAGGRTHRTRDSRLRPRPDS